MLGQGPIHYYANCMDKKVATCSCLIRVVGGIAYFGGGGCSIELIPRGRVEYINQVTPLVRLAKTQHCLYSASAFGGSSPHLPLFPLLLALYAPFTSLAIMSIDWMSPAVLLKTSGMFSIPTSRVNILLKWTPYSDLHQFLTLDNWNLLS